VPYMSPRSLSRCVCLFLCIVQYFVRLSSVCAQLMSTCSCTFFETPTRRHAPLCITSLLRQLWQRRLARCHATVLMPRETRCTVCSSCHVLLLCWHFRRVCHRPYVYFREPIHPFPLVYRVCLVHTLNWLDADPHAGVGDEAGTFEHLNGDRRGWYVRDQAPLQDHHRHLLLDERCNHVALPCSCIVPKFAVAWPSRKLQIKP